MVEQRINSEVYIKVLCETHETHWGLALLKGIREPHEVNKNYFDLGGYRTHDLWIRSTITLPTELRGRTGDDLGGESWRRESKGTFTILNRPRLSLCYLVAHSAK